MKKFIFLIIASFVFLQLSLAAADVPMMVNYQGYVEYGNGVPLNGNGYFKFAIVNQAGTTTYWSNDGTSTTGDEPDAAVTISVTEGVFTVKLGDTDLTNMDALDTTPFNQQNIYIRVWFSDDGTSYELLSPDTQIVSAGFAITADSVVNAPPVSWNDIPDIPADIADGDDVGITAESDPTVPATIKDGISWLELTGIPADIADGDDVGITTESDPTVPASIKDGISWLELTDIPADIANGDDVGITSEDDPQVGTLTNGTWCTSDGTQVNCTSNAPGNLWSQSGSNIYYNSGGVSVGTTSLDYGADLQVANRINIMDGTSSNPNLYIGDSGSQYMQLQFNSSGDYAQLFTPSTYDIVLMPGGNVGIGTTSPNNLLHIESSNTDPDTSQMTIEADSSYGQPSYATLEFRANPLSASAGPAGRIKAFYPINQYTAATMTFQTIASGPSFVDVMSLRGGNVGIGTTNPSYDLHVNGTAAKPGGGSWSDSSDGRLKKNVENLNGALDILTQLQGVTFEWINPEEHGNQTGVLAGFIAQELEKVFPAWVSEINPKGEDKNLVADEEKIKTVHFPHDFNAYLIEAIKQLKAEIDELKQENAVLKETLMTITQ